MMPLAWTGYRPGMSSPEKSLRQPLLEARADVQRQIEILESSLDHGRDARVMFGPVITDLTATLKLKIASLTWELKARSCREL
jgi:hypothetical protein